MKPKFFIGVGEETTEALLTYIFKKVPDPGISLYFISDACPCEVIVDGTNSKIDGLDFAIVTSSANPENLVIFYSASSIDEIMVKREDAIKELISRKNVRFLRTPFQNNSVLTMYEELLITN